MARRVQSDEVVVEAGDAQLAGTLIVPEKAGGIVLFAHGSGSSRFSPRNQFVARTLHEGRLATLLFDLLTAGENVIDEQTRELRFDIALLSRRLVGVIDWLKSQPGAADLPIGLFGASTGSAAALNAAAERRERVKAVVSRGGRPDLASQLERVGAPTLLIVGGQDHQVITLNQKAAACLRAEHRLEIVPGATHLFEEPGTLAAVAELARNWFQRYLRVHDHASQQ